MSGVEYIVPAPDDEAAAISMDGLVKALESKKQVAIVRFVKRKNAAPLFGVLHPHTVTHTGADVAEAVSAAVPCLLFNQLPFYDDFRDFVFPSFKDVEASLKPSKGVCVNALCC
jgi:hypothetical protein